MSKVASLILVICACLSLPATAQLDLGDRWDYHTVWAYPKTTNHLHIPAGTTFQLIEEQGLHVRYRHTQHSDAWRGFGGNWKLITGPVLIEFQCVYPQVEAPLSYRTRTNFHPPEKTEVIPAGQGGVVMLQCSSNLVDWVTTTNGIHTNLPSMKFFRVHVERISQLTTPP